MNLYLISTDQALYKQLKEIDIFETINFSSIDKLKDLEEEAVVLISDNELPYSELSTLSFKPTNSVFYMLHNMFEPRLEKTVKAICDSKDIKLIPPRLTVEQIVDTILQSFQPDKDKINNVISFFSPIGNSGTTTTCLSVAMALRQQTKAKIGVLLLNAWDSGTDQLNYKGKYLDEIKSKLSAKLIFNEQEFLSMFHMVEKDSLYVLGGNRSVKLERIFTKEEINYLIEQSKEMFDVVLIDSGNHFDNALMVQSLRESNFRFLIVNQQTKGVKKFNDTFKEVLNPIGYKKEDFLMIINDYEEQTFLPSTKEIYNEIQVPMLTTITHNKYGKVAERENRSLYTFDDISYKESINLIVKSVSSFVGIALDTDVKKDRKSLFSRWRA